MTARSSARKRILVSSPSQSVRMLIERTSVGIRCRRQDRGRALPIDADALQDEADADGGDQRRQPRRGAEPAVDDPVDAPVEHAAEEHRGEHGDERDERDLRPAGAGGNPNALNGGERQKRAHHEDFAVGEVDELDDAVDEGVPQRDQGDERPVRHPENQVLGKEGPVEFHAGLSAESRRSGKFRAG